MSAANHIAPSPPPLPQKQKPARVGGGYRADSVVAMLGLCASGSQGEQEIRHG
jgi:hypothetical protein